MVQGRERERSCLLRNYRTRQYSQEPEVSWAVETRVTQQLHLSIHAGAKSLVVTHSCHSGQTLAVVLGQGLPY